MESKCFSNDVGSLAFGNDKEFQARIDKIMDGVKDNPVLKQAGVKVGDFSKNVDNKIIPLSPEMQKEAEALTLHYTGMTPDYAQKLSQEMPGNQQKDAVNLMRFLSGRPLPKNVAAKFEHKSEVKDISKPQSSQLTAAQQAFIQSSQYSK